MLSGSLIVQYSKKTHMSYASTSSTSSTSSTTKTEQENEALAHRFHMEIFQQGKFALADEILAPDFVLRNPMLPSEFTHGPEGVKKFASGVVDSLPGRQFTHHDTISKGDKVLIRFTLTGIPKKEMLGIRPSDKPITISGFDLFRITTDGKKIAEMWQQFNVGSWP
jgi:predicted SnoaL-like aldol condensation-catalyzing enzyme